MLAMTRIKLAVLAMLLAGAATVAQQAPVSSPLLDHMSGHWVARGQIAGTQTVHDIDGEWIIQHHYLRLHEVSRENDDKGQPSYEAMIFVGWNSASQTNTCVWLDVYGGSSIESIGVATPAENNLPFIFKNEKGEISFRNSFVYDPAADAWEWRMSNVDKGVDKPFGLLKLTRK